MKIRRFVRVAIASVLPLIAVVLNRAPVLSQVCPGDCNNNGVVDINDLTVAEKIVAQQALFSDCPSFDTNHDGAIDVNDFILVFRYVLSRRCPDTPTPTASLTPTPSPTSSATRAAPPTNTPTRTITVTPSLTPRRFTAYVANKSDNTVSVIDTARDEVIATLGVGSKPQGVAVSPDFRSVYVTNQASTAEPSTISVIDTTTQNVSTISPPVPDKEGSFGVAFSPDGALAYVTNIASNALFGIDTATKAKKFSETRMLTGPYGIAVSRSHIYVTDANGMQQGTGRTVTVFDAPPSASITIITVGTYPRGIALRPQGDVIYVANFTSGTVSVIGTDSNTVLSTVPVGLGPEGVAFTPDGLFALVTNANSSNVSVIDTARAVADPMHAVVGTVGAGGFPFGVAITPDGKRAYVTVKSTNSVVVIDTQVARTNSNAAVVDTIPVGTAPVGIAISDSPG